VASDPTSLLHVNWHPSRRQLRGFAILAFLVFGLLGWVGWHGAFELGAALLPSNLPSALAGLVAALCVLAALFEPRWALPLHRLLTAASLPFAFVSTWLLLLALFFGVITPIGWLMRRLRPSPAAHGSAWVECRRPVDKSDYFRQS
jgi:hypothetical protein